MSDAQTRPTNRPPASRVRSAAAREPHRLDGERDCPHCARAVHHFYEGTQVHAGVTDSMWEVRHFTCAQCGSTRDVPHTVRLDLDGESHMLVVDRREPQPQAEVAAIVALLQGAA